MLWPFSVSFAGVNQCAQVPILAAQAADGTAPGAKAGPSFRSVIRARF
jgi:hypothetical protein